MAVLKTTSPDALGGRTKTPALEDRSVFQGEDCSIQALSSGGTGGNFYFNTARVWIQVLGKQDGRRRRHDANEQSMFFVT